MRAAMVERTTESTANCNKVHEDDVRLILILIFGQAYFFFGISLLTFSRPNEGSPKKLPFLTVE